MRHHPMLQQVRAGLMDKIIGRTSFLFSPGSCLLQIIIHGDMFYISIGGDKR
jgi:hypothetical protein